MNTNDHDNRVDEQFGDLLAGLERLAQDLDTQRYPGAAWPVRKPRLLRLRRRSLVTVAALLTTAAAIAVVAVYHRAGDQARIEPTPADQQVAVQAPAPPDNTDRAEPTAPRLVIVEDMESYSVIDLSSDEPVVSFAMKDSYSPVSVVPMLSEPASPTPTL